MRSDRLHQLFLLNIALQLFELRFAVLQLEIECALPFVGLDPATVELQHVFVKLLQAAVEGSPFGSKSGLPALDVPIALGQRSLPGPKSFELGRTLRLERCPGLVE